MSTGQKEILIAVMAFAIIVGGGYTFLKSTTSIGVPRNSADPFICSPLYKYPEVWACGMQQEGAPEITVFRYITNKENKFK